MYKVGEEVLILSEMEIVYIFEEGVGHKGLGYWVWHSDGDIGFVYIGEIMKITPTIRVLYGK